MALLVWATVWFMKISTENCTWLIMSILTKTNVSPGQAYINPVALKQLEGTDRYTLEVQQPRTDPLHTSE